MRAGANRCKNTQKIAISHNKPTISYKVAPNIHHM